MTNDNDAALIEACNDFLASDAAYYAACDASYTVEDDKVTYELGDACYKLLGNLLEFRSTTAEGIRAKASVVGAAYLKNANSRPMNDHLIEWILSDIGVAVQH